MVSYTRLIGLMDVTIDINDIFNKITYAKPTYNKIKPILHEQGVLRWQIPN